MPWTCSWCRSAAARRSTPRRAAEIAERLQPRWIVPMHYRTEALDFLEPVDGFVERFDTVTRLDEPEVDFASAPEGVVVLAAPVGG